MEKTQMARWHMFLINDACDSDLVRMDVAGSNPELKKDRQADENDVEEEDEEEAEKVNVAVYRLDFLGASSPCPARRDSARIDYGKVSPILVTQETRMNVNGWTNDSSVYACGYSASRDALLVVDFKVSDIQGLWALPLEPCRNYLRMEAT